MYGGLIISIFIAFVVCTNVHGGTNEMAKLTPAQLDLVDGLFKEHHWPEQWADMVDKLNADDSAVPEAEKKLQMIPLMLACDHGVRLVWFLTLAACVIDECNRLTQNGGCWNALTDGLQYGSQTVSKVMRTLERVHSTIDDDDDDNISSDAFYRNMSAVQHFLDEHSVTECCADPEDELNYIELLASVTDSLQNYLIVNCEPYYKPLNIQELLANERNSGNPTKKRYVSYASKMDDYVGYIAGRLAKLGFHYDDYTGRITFKSHP